MDLAKRHRNLVEAVGGEKPDTKVGGELGDLRVDVLNELEGLPVGDDHEYVADIDAPGSVILPPGNLPDVASQCLTQLAH